MTIEEYSKAAFSKCDEYGLPGRFSIALAGACLCSLDDNDGYRVLYDLLCDTAKSGNMNINHSSDETSTLIWKTKGRSFYLELSKPKYMEALGGKHQQ